MDLDDGAFDRELAALLLEQPRAVHQLALVDLPLALRRVEQRQRRQRVGAASSARPAALSGSGSGSGGSTASARPLDRRRRRRPRRGGLQRRGGGADHGGGARRLRRVFRRRSPQRARLGGRDLVGRDSSRPRPRAILASRLAVLAGALSRCFFSTSCRCLLAPALLAPARAARRAPRPSDRCSMLADAREQPAERELRRQDDRRGRAASGSG